MNHSRNARYWIHTLGLQSHPEGGYFNEIYRSPEMVRAAGLPERYRESRTLGTSIYFLLEAPDISRLHRLQSDEVWHFYAGSSLTIHIIDPEGKYGKLRLGQKPEHSQYFQISVPKMHWFGATVDDPDSYTLVGCTMAPGFEFDDFELGDRETLLQKYPEHREIIVCLT